MKKNIEIRNQLFDTISGLTDEQLNKHPEFGRWSIVQVMDHLYLMERAITKGIADTLAADVRNKAAVKPIHLAVDRSMKVEAPAYLEPSSEFITIESMTEKLTQSRKLLSEVTTHAEDEDLENKSFPHPIFSNLSLKQWIPFVGIHELRHIEQIEELKAKL